MERVVYRIIFRKPTVSEWLESSIRCEKTPRYFLEYRPFLRWKKLKIPSDRFSSSFDTEREAEKALRKRALELYDGKSKNSNVIAEFVFSDLAKAREI